MNTRDTLRENDIVQINPQHQCGGCLATVSKIKTWGIIGVIKIPYKGETYLILNYSDFEKVGKAIFID